MSFPFEHSVLPLAGSACILLLVLVLVRIAVLQASPFTRTKYIQSALRQMHLVFARRIVFDATSGAFLMTLLLSAYVVLMPARDLLGRWAIRADFAAVLRAGYQEGKGFVLPDGEVFAAAAATYLAILLFWLFAAPYFSAARPWHRMVRYLASSTKAPPQNSIASVARWLAWSSEPSVFARSRPFKAGVPTGLTLESVWRRILQQMKPGVQERVRTQQDDARRRNAVESMNRLDAEAARVGSAFDLNRLGELLVRVRSSWAQILLLNVASLLIAFFATVLVVVAYSPPPDASPEAEQRHDPGPAADAATLG